jgi:hypothetical protein
MAPVSSAVLPLGTLFRTERRFVVPRFQRNYSWDESQVSMFWQDIFQTFDVPSTEYFLGAIVINKPQGEYAIVIDGQQRLITTSILIAALKSHFHDRGEDRLVQLAAQDYLLQDADANEDYQPRLQLNRTDRPFFEQFLIGECPVREMARMRTDDTLAPSNRLLADCFCYMHAKLADYFADGWTSQRLFEAVRRALDEQIFVIRLDVRSDYDAFKLFETLNDRGLDLSEADLLKNHLMSASGPLLPQTQNDWEMMEENLGNERVLKLVRHHWLSSRGAISSGGLFSDIKAAMTSPEITGRYAAELCRASQLYAALRDSKSHVWALFPPEQQDGVREQVESLGLLRADQVFIALLAALETDPKGFPDYLDCMVNFIFRYTTICNMSSSRLLPVMIDMARHIRQSGRVDTPEIFSLYLAKLYPGDSEFHSAFSRKTIRHNGLARYILERLSASIETGQAGAPTGPATDLEHILPKRFSSAWATQRRDFPGGAEKYVHRLGNMTLLSVALNRELGNMPFEVKRKAYAGEPIKLAASVVEAEKWTAEEITRRQNWMAGLAIKIWRCVDEA